MTPKGFSRSTVIRISSPSNGLAVTRVDPLAINEPAFDDITLGVMVGNSFYFNAAAQWKLFGG